MCDYCYDVMWSHRMEIVAGMLKRDQQSLVKRVTDLESAMDQQVNKIKVQYNTTLCNISLCEYYYYYYYYAIN